MWEIGSSSHSHQISSLGREINVLLVEHGKGRFASTTNLLQTNSYKVTKVETAVAALSLLSDGKKKFDVVLVDTNIKDMDPFTLLKLSANMDLLTMLMSENDDDAIISKALTSGAFLLVRKPFSFDVVKQMRQHVIRERMRRVNNYDDEANVIVEEEINGVLKNSKDMKRKVGITINEGAGLNRKEKNGVAKKGKRGRKSKKNQECHSVSEIYKVRNGRVKKRTSTEWTEELHEKFIDAVNQLGEGRCYPKEILETMNVPGLTRMQVASHLQKCRNNNWQTPVMRKYRYPSRVEGSNIRSQWRDNHKRFGSMPHVNQIEPNVRENIYTTDMEARENQQNHRARNRYGSYPLMSKGRGPANFNNGAQTMVNTDGELQANFIVNETIYSATMEKASENHSKNPINLDHSITVVQNQPNDDIFNFLYDNMNDYVPDFSAVLQEGSIVNQGSAYQPIINDYSLPDQDTITNQDIGGQWSASA